MRTQYERNMTMPKRSRFRHILKWAGAIAFVLWLGSFLIGCRYGDGKNWEVRMGYGAFGLDWGETVDHVGLNSIHYHEYADGLDVRFDIAGGIRFVPWPGVRSFQHGCFVICPLWLLAAPVSILSGFLFWRDRRMLHYHRIEKGLCQACGYNLTGNLSGICPECGNPCKSDANDL